MSWAARETSYPHSYVRFEAGVGFNVGTEVYLSVGVWCSNCRRDISIAPFSFFLNTVNQRYISLSGQWFPPSSLSYLENENVGHFSTLPRNEKILI